MSVTRLGQVGVGVELVVDSAEPQALAKPTAGQSKSDHASLEARIFLLFLMPDARAPFKEITRSGAWQQSCPTKPHLRPTPKGAIQLRT